MKNKKQEKNVVGEAGALASAAAMAAAVAGAYFLYGSKDAKKNRKIVKSWALKLKAEALEKIEKLNSIDEKTYKEAISNVAEKYSKLKNIDSSDVEKVKKELNSHWKDIKKSFLNEKNKKTVKKTTPKKTIKKVVKKK